MSTLSPLGRYGSRGRRRLRTALVLLLALGALVAAAWVGWLYAGTKDTSSTPGPSTSVGSPSNGCSPSPSGTPSVSTSVSGTPSVSRSHVSRSPSSSTLPKPKTITLNVYNSTTKAGLARTTSTLLASRGFTIGNVKNDPAPTPVKGVAEVRYGPKGALAAQVVAAEVQGAKLVLDKRTSSDVDIALGAAFKHLATPAQVKAALSPSATPPPVSTPSPSCSTS